MPDRTFARLAMENACKLAFQQQCTVSTVAWLGRGCETCLQGRGVAAWLAKPSATSSVANAINEQQQSALAVAAPTSHNFSTTKIRARAGDVSLNNVLRAVCSVMLTVPLGDATRFSDLS